MAYTIKDVASLAGVSLATASRVLNGKPGVKASNRQKVLDTARELNYLPNQLAKGMKTKKTRTIGLVVADITNPFYSDVAKGIELRARENNYTVIICNTDNKSSNQKEIIDNLRERHVDGFILASVELRDKPASDLIREGYPCILFHRHLEAYKGHFVGVDEHEGVRQVLEHLHQLGHRQIAFVSGPRRFSTGMERLRAYLEITKQLSIDRPPYLVQEGSYDRMKTANGVKTLLALPSPPTAIFAANDLMAMEVLNCILEMGYDVPKDFSVAGFDNIPITAHQGIQLTTVDIQTEHYARVVIDNLMNILEGIHPPDKTIHILIKPQLCARKTTGPP